VPNLDMEFRRGLVVEKGGDRAYARWGTSTARLVPRPRRVLGAAVDEGDAPRMAKRSANNAIHHHKCDPRSGLVRNVVNRHSPG
jgi:hypothetical protein